MSTDIPRVWWSRDPTGNGRPGIVVNDPKGRHSIYNTVVVPQADDDAIPLVPRADRDELREALDVAIGESVGDLIGTRANGDELLAAVLDVLAERGLID